MSWFHRSDPQRKYSAERLQNLYAELLRTIDINNDDLLPRGEIEQGLGTNHSLSAFFSVVPRRYIQYDRSGNCAEDQSIVLLKQDLAAAFHLMAATRSCVNRTTTTAATTNTALRNETTAQAFKLAHRIENRVVSIIREIGEVVVNSEHPKQNTTRKGLRDDEIFAYFCEKAILALFVVICKDKPATNSSSTSGETNCQGHSCFHGVVWSAKVKAQIFQSIGLLVSGARNPSTLYFYLSQNCINELILSILPINQWTDPATEILLPAISNLLKTLSLQLGGSPELFPLFTEIDNYKKAVASFSLFSALVEITTSIYGQSDSYVYATCLNLIVGLLRISNAPVRSWICHSEKEQKLLCKHIANFMMERYRRIANLTTGPVVDAIRSKAIHGQLLALNDQINTINDIFSCGIDSLAVRLCETLMQHFVIPLIQNLLPRDGRNFISVGISDLDVIPVMEADAQAASYVLSRLLLHLEFGPFHRMVTVTLLHHQTPKQFLSCHSTDKNAPYSLTSALNAIVSGNASDSVPNPYRDAILKALAGSYGEWRFIISAILLESILATCEMDILIGLDMLLLSVQDDTVVDSFPDLAIALELFLSRQHSCESAVSIKALECSSSLAIQYFIRLSDQQLQSLSECYNTAALLQKSRLISLLYSVRNRFYTKCLAMYKGSLVTDIFVDVVDAEVKIRYKRFEKTRHGGNYSGFCYLIPQHSTSLFGCGPEALVRMVRAVGSNEVETTRFYSSMAIHFRAVCKFVDRLKNREDFLTSTDWNHWVDEAGNLSSVFGCLRRKVSAGTDLDLHGRMTFRFQTESYSSMIQSSVVPERISSISYSIFSSMDEDQTSTELILVLDPMDLYIVQPFPRKELSRGTIICSMPLLDVIAAASDGVQLHIACRHDDVEGLIKSGNMVLTFDVPGTCLVVAQFLDRCKVVLRNELYEKIVELFSDYDEPRLESVQEHSTNSVLGVHHKTAVIPQVHSF